MADFQFHDRHLPPRPDPDVGVIDGTLYPLIDGPGDFRIRISEHGSGRLIADDTVTSPDGEPVAVTLDHSEEPAPGGSRPFHKNVRVQVGDEPPRAPVPIWLR